MSKEYLVIRAGRVVYTPGHYDKEGARATARQVLKSHPRAVVRIVRIEETLVGKPQALKGWQPS